MTYSDTEKERKREREREREREIICPTTNDHNYQMKEFHFGPKQAYLEHNE